MNVPLLPPESAEQSAAARFGTTVPAPDIPATLCRDAWQRAADLGLFRQLIGRGSLNGDVAVDVLEGLGQSCASEGFLLAMAAHCFAVGGALATFGAEDHEETLAALREGRSIAALAATESNAGSDVMAIQTRYAPVDGGFRLEGEKRFITNVAEADVYLVFATKDPRLHTRGIAAFLVRRDTPGLRAGENQPRPGLSGCSIGNLYLDGAVVPQEAIVGRPGKGSAVFQAAMLFERCLIAAVKVGVMRRLFLDSLRHAQQRRQFGRPIGSNQYVAGRIVDLLGRYTTSRLLIRQSAAKLSAGRLSTGEASLTKLLVTEAVLEATMTALRIRGGEAIVGRTAMAGDVWGSLASVIYSGTSDVQRVIVAAELGLET
ncbi:MAG TPA: acyl-CoA dehydrogenase [Thermoanaerobaculia bacterium]